MFMHVLINVTRSPLMNEAHIHSFIKTAKENWGKKYMHF